MAKSKLIVSPSDNLPLVGVDTDAKLVPKVVGLRPCGCQVLVEVLTSQEMMNTLLTVTDKHDLKVPLQGYVRAVGPAFKSEEYGFKVGDRVLISGGGVMAPEYDSCHRDRFLMEPHAIKSVLSEE